jgi:hypothetical protein
MDDRDTSILTQVAFKGAIEWAADKLDLSDPQGQATFETVQSYLTESLFTAVRAQLGGEKAGQLVHANFPGTQSFGPADQGPIQQPQAAPQPQFAFQGAQQAQQPANGGYGAQGQSAAPGPHNYQLTVKGNQFAALPQWLYDEAAPLGIHEVYDNRDSPPELRRPLFKATTGGRDAHPFWGPGNRR